MIERKRLHKRRTNSNQRRSGSYRNSMQINAANRPKGSLSKILEKYITLAQDANSNGDRIVAENYYQYAEHYQRLINQNGITKDTNNEKKNTVIENHSNSGKPSRTERAISANDQKVKNASPENEKKFPDKKNIKKDFTSDGIEALKPFEFSINQKKD